MVAVEIVFLVGRMDLVVDMGEAGAELGLALPDDAPAEFVLEVAELLAQNTAIRPSRTAVLRAAIERGLADMHTELKGKTRKR